MSTPIPQFARLKLYIAPGAHKFTVSYPPEGQYGPVVTICSRCGRTPAEVKE